jgi:hypothetical protein
LVGAAGKKCGKVGDKAVDSSFTEQDGKITVSLAPGNTLTAGQSIEVTLKE